MRNSMEKCKKRKEAIQRDEISNRKEDLKILASRTLQVSHYLYMYEKIE